jgi:hypothetical protein
MGSIVDWGNIPSGGRNNSGAKGGGGMNDKFLKLSQGDFRIRPVGKPVQFHAYYIQNPTNPKSFIRAFTENPDDCVIRRKHNIEPKLRYAMNVIDRKDGKLKVMEAPASVFERIQEWGRVAQQDPGKTGGADFAIKVTLPPDGDRRRTNYETTPIMQSPFTVEEQEMIKRVGLHNLEEIFKPTPQNEIEAKLFPAAAPAASQVKTQQRASQETASSANDLGF